MPHLNGIYIHKNAILGENCTVFQQVTIGVNEIGKMSRAAPNIGDNVYIGAGAKIIGGIIIGDNVIIGANAVITKSIPSGLKVVGCNRVLSE
jgi:serine O-acetyltransferase